MKDKSAHIENLNKCIENLKSKMVDRKAEIKAMKLKIERIQEDLQKKTYNESELTKSLNSMTAERSKWVKKMRRAGFDV